MSIFPWQRCHGDVSAPRPCTSQGLGQVVAIHRSVHSGFFANRDLLYCDGGLPVWALKIPEKRLSIIEGSFRCSIGLAGTSTHK
jgi:hypothetical protein